MTALVATLVSQPLLPGAVQHACDFLFNWGRMDITWHSPPSPFSSVQGIWALKAHPRPCTAVTVIQFQDIIAPKETSCPLAAPEIPPLSAPGNPMGSLISEASCEWQHAAAALHVWLLPRGVLFSRSAVW